MTPLRHLRSGWAFARLLRCLLGATGLLLAAAGLPAAEEPEPDFHEGQYATVGILRTGFTHVSENDAKAAFTALTQQLGSKLGYKVGTQVEVFDDVPAFRAACHDGRVQMLLIGSWDLLTMKVSDQIGDTFVIQTEGATRHAWHLLARTDRPLHTLADLRGKRVMVVHNGTTHLGVPWIETLCLERSRELPQHYFSSFEIVTKPSAALLPVFFGQADACIVDEASLSLMRQMNPQVTVNLHALESSPPMSNALVCLTRGGWRADRVRRDIVDQLQRLQEEPAGRQLLTLFKCERMVICPPGQLDSVAVLHELHERLLTQEVSP